MTYVKINGTMYLATVNGKIIDTDWDGRESKAITTDELTYAEALALFVDDTDWSIVERNTVPVYDEQTGEPTGETKEVSNEYVNSDFSVAGDLTDHRDGRITIKMGKPTDLELAYEELYG